MCYGGSILGGKGGGDEKRKLSDRKCMSDIKGVLKGAFIRKRN